ncbi:MAG TPA: fasciclin domain-containing protein [Vicinamibacterales bacterium]|nr:fasciclin domain-containing protein [Vicinamibacterales bacterium]
MAHLSSILRASCIALPMVYASGIATAADIVETASEAGSFQTLLTAAEAAGLVDTLKSEGPFTVFAPTDEAFAKLPEGTVESLLKPENQDQLKAILTYHVVPGKTMSSDIAGKELEVETVQGETIAIDASDGTVMVDDATVVQADIETDNGVIHVIDTVLMPQM